MIKKNIAILISLLLSINLFFSLTATASAASKPAKPTISKVAVSKNIATITWKKAKNAKKYEVNVGGKTYTVKTTSYKFTGKSNTSYSAKVRGVNGKTKGSWSAVKSFKTGMSDADTIQSLKAENAKLKTENSNLKNENSTLQSTNKSLSSANLSLKSENSELQASIDDLEKQIKELQDKVKELEAKIEELTQKLEELLGAPSSDSVKGIWYYDQYSTKDDNYIIYTKSYIFDGNGTVMDNDSNMGTYTINGDKVTISISNSNVELTLNSDNETLTSGNKTFKKSAPIPANLAYTWRIQGEGVWNKMYLERDGTLHFEYKDVEDSPTYIAHMIDEDSIVILSEIYDYRDGLLIERRLPTNYYAKYMNVYGQWKCLELNPDLSSYDGVIWIDRDGKGEVWSVTENKYLNYDGEVYTLNNDNETFSIEKDGKTYIYERWHDPNIM